MRGKTLLVFMAVILISGVTWMLLAKKETGYDCVDCNVLLISIDTLRADHLGCYDYPRPTSPNVDRFAEDSVQFLTAIAHAPSTEPSHGAIFTSMLPAHHGGLRALRQPISQDAVMMAEMLKDAGYATVSYNGGGQVSKAFGFDRGFDVYESGSGTFDEKVSQARGWFEQNDPEKFFMFLHTYEVHAPYTPEKRFLDLFDEGYSGRLGDRTSSRLLIDINEGKRKISSADLQHIINTYDAEIRSMDEAFGKLMAFLEEQGLLENTIVLFTSDHGEEFGEHGQVGRHSHALYDELLRVPLLVRFPQKKFGGKKVAEQVRGIDLLPTFTEILGIEPLEQFQGTSLVPLLTGGDGDPRPAVSQVDSAHPQPPSSIRTVEEKLILGSQKYVENPLYQWFTYRAEFEIQTHDMLVAIESFHEERTVRILVDGELERTQRIGPEKQFISVALGDAVTRKIAIESLDPCKKPEEVGVDLDLPCVSFRIFNPYEYYDLANDPAESDNLFGSADRGKSIVTLEQQLRSLLAGPGAETANEPIEIDETTREQLKALGYIQ